jgi:hypothetical protein
MGPNDLFCEFRWLSWLMRLSFWAAIILWALSLLGHLPAGTWRVSLGLIACNLAVHFSLRAWYWAFRKASVPLSPLGEPVWYSGQQIDDDDPLPPGTRVLFVDVDKPVRYRAIVRGPGLWGSVWISFLGWDQVCDAQAYRCSLERDSSPIGLEELAPEPLQGAGVSPADAVESVCRAGEQVLWAGRPRKGWFPSPPDSLWYLLAMGLLVCVAAPPLGFILFAPESWGFALWLFLVECFVFYLAVGQFLLHYWQRSRTVYGITTKRVIIIFGLSQQQVNWLPLDRAKTTLEGDGRITFSPGTASRDWYRLHQRAMVVSGPCGEFDLGTDAQAVYDLIISLQRQSDNSPIPATSLNTKRGDPSDQRFQPPMRAEEEGP